jgi:hypothetical protein
MSGKSSVVESDDSASKLFRLRRSGMRADRHVLQTHVLLGDC